MANKNSFSGLTTTRTFEKWAVQRVENTTDINHYAVDKY